MSKEINEIFLTEIRLNRTAIGALREDINKLDKDVFSNRVKLSIFITSISLITNIIVIILSDKLTAYIAG